MRKPLILFVLSLLLAMSALFPGNVLGEEVFLTGIVAAFAAFVLLVVAAFRGDAPEPREIAVLDGSNVMHWRENQPDLETVRLVAAAARGRGLKPVVWFDANAGYLTRGKYQGPGDLAHQIGVPRRDIRLAPKGVPADPLILKSAQRMGARVITNDRYRDWMEIYPSIRDQGFLVPGHVRGGSVHLSLD